MLAAIEHKENEGEESINEPLVKKVLLNGIPDLDYVNRSCSLKIKGIKRMKKVAGMIRMMGNERFDRLVIDLKYDREDFLEVCARYADSSQNLLTNSVFKSFIKLPKLKGIPAHDNYCRSCRESASWTRREGADVLVNRGAHVDQTGECRQHLRAGQAQSVVTVVTAEGTMRTVAVNSTGPLSTVGHAWVRRTDRDENVARAILPVRTAQEVTPVTAVSMSSRNVAGVVIDQGDGTMAVEVNSEVSTAEADRDIPGGTQLMAGGQMSVQSQFFMFFSTLRFYTHCMLSGE